MSRLYQTAKFQENRTGKILQIDFKIDLMEGKSAHLLALTIDNASTRSLYWCLFLVAAWSWRMWPFTSLTEA